MGKMQPVRPNTSMKFNMSFTNFAGGLNTVTANDLLKDEECVKLVNVNLAERGCSVGLAWAVMVKHSLAEKGKDSLFSK